MKYVAALICLLFAFVAAPTFAHEMTNDCDKQAAKIKDHKKHAKFMKECLAKVHEDKIRRTGNA